MRAEWHRVTGLGAPTGEEALGELAVSPLPDQGWPGRCPAVFSGVVWGCPGLILPLVHCPARQARAGGVRAPGGGLTSGPGEGTPNCRSPPSLPFASVPPGCDRREKPVYGPERWLHAHVPGAPGPCPLRVPCRILAGSGPQGLRR